MNINKIIILTITLITNIFVINATVFEHIENGAKFGYKITSSQEKEVSLILYDIVDFNYSYDTLMLKQMVEHDGIEYTVTEISDRVFKSRYDLYYVSIPNTVTNIGDDAFLLCGHLKTVILPNSLLSIGKYSFCRCINLSNISFPETLSEIGDKAFAYTQLSHISLQSNVSVIGYGAFSFCFDLEKIEIHSDNIIIGGEAFYATRYMRNNRHSPIYFKNTLYRYSKNKRTKHYKINDGVLNISSFAFLNSDHICSITLPKSIKSIGAYAFVKAEKLKTLIIEAEIPPNSSDNYIVDAKNNISIYVPDKSLQLYKRHELWEKMDIKPMSDLKK